MTAGRESMADHQDRTEAFIASATFEGRGGGTLPYRQYLSPGLAPGEKVPLIFYLHGAGERGSDNEKQMIHGVRPILRYCREGKVPVALVAPQCPADGKWVDTDFRGLAHRMAPEPPPPMKLAMELLEDRLEALPVDPDRIYVTGLSMGGFATWDLLQRRPGLFAAAMPVCGGGDPKLAWRMREVPIWAFHGDADSIVPVDRTRSMVAALWACGGKIRYREYPGVDHAAWDPTYDDPEVLDWLFAQKRG